MNFKILFIDMLLSIVSITSLAQPISGLKTKITNPNGKSLLLLGINAGLGYKTIVVLHENGKSEVIRELPYLLSPQKEVFLYINERRFSHEECNEYPATINDNKIYFAQDYKSLQDSLTKKATKPRKHLCDDSIDSTHRDDMIRHLSIRYLIPGFITFSEWVDHLDDDRDRLVSEGPDHRQRLFTRKIIMNMNFFATMHEWPESPSLNPYSFKQDIKEWEQISAAFSNFVNADEGDIDYVRVIHYDSLERYVDKAHSNQSILNRLDPDFYLSEINYELDHYLGATQLLALRHKKYYPYGLLKIEAGPIDKKYGSYNYSLPTDSLKTYMRQTGDDVFASPGNDVIYYLEGGSYLKDSNLKDIMNKWQHSIGRGDVIMAEWAIGANMDKWLKVINENPGHEHPVKDR